MRKIKKDYGIYLINHSLLINIQTFSIFLLIKNNLLKTSFYIYPISSYIFILFLCVGGPTMALLD